MNANEWLRASVGLLVTALLVVSTADGRGLRRRWVARGSSAATPNHARPDPVAAAGTRATQAEMPRAGVYFTQLEGTKLNYPATRKVEQTDNYHGTEVKDPYRWLENVDSEETKKWVEAQNKVTFDWLAQVPAREALRQRLTQLWNYERFGLPHKKGGRYFFTRNDGLQNQSAIYVIDRGGDAIVANGGQGVAGARMLLDPNKLSTDGTVALTNWVASEDGNYLAYGLAGAGSDWQEWRVLDVNSGKVLADQVKWVKFSRASWTPDGKGFYYSRYDEPPPGEQFTGTNYYQKLYFHRLGEPQAMDSLVYKRDDEKEWGFNGEVTDDGRYLVISVWKGTDPRNQVFYRDLSSPDGAIVELLTGFDAEYEFIGNDGSVFWFVTDLHAPLKRIIAIDVREPRQENWKELIAESKDTLESASVIGEHFVVSYLKDACSAVKVFSLSGQHVRDVVLPDLGSAGGFAGKRTDRETFYTFTSYTVPGSIYRYDVTTGESKVFREPKVAFDPKQFETRQVFFESKDGTKVPLMIVGKRGFSLDGSNPTILYAYGGFNISLTPSFSVSNIAWLEMGGLYAVANLRGGGEYGREWHEAGMLDRKQNVFDDFIAAAEWLIGNKYTSREKLAIRGGSNGGLLVGAAITQRPELFAAAVPAVGVMDMLRYHKFTIGWAWVNEYGSSDDPKQFETLFQYSPFHRLQPGTQYPATMVTTADHDDRVVPGHSFKFAAALQAAQGGDKPALIRIESRAGHGAGTPTTKLIESATDVLAFLSATLGTKKAGD